MRKKSNKSGKCQLVSETERGNFGSKQTPDKQTVGERFSKLFMLKIFLIFVFFRCFATYLGCHALGVNYLAGLCNVWSGGGRVVRAQVRFRHGVLFHLGIGVQGCNKGVGGFQALHI